MNKKNINFSNVEYIISNNNQIDVLVIEDGKILEYLKKMDKLPNNIKLILYYAPIDNDLVKNFKIPIVSFGAFMESVVGKNVDRLPAKVSFDNVISVVYTNGTFSSRPKAVEISYRNINAVIQNILKSVGNVLGIGGRFLSYQPLSNIVYQIMDIYLPIYTVGCVWFGDRDIVDLTLMNTLIDIKPNIMVGCNKIWATLKEKVEKKINSSYVYSALPKLVIKDRILKDIGLDECKLFYNIGEMVSADNYDFCLSIGVRINEMYYVTEAVGPVSLCGNSDDVPKGSVGKPLDGVEVKVNQSDGEIMLRGISRSKCGVGRSWIKTGDIGYLKDGYIYITRKKKPLLITVNGDRINPQKIETRVKKYMPVFEHCVIVGENKNFLGLLLVPKMNKENKKLADDFFKIDPDLVEIDHLTSLKLKNYIDLNVKKINKMMNRSGCQIDIKKWIIIVDLFVVGHELTSSLQLRRKYINDKYKNKIDMLFKNSV